MAKPCEEIGSKQIPREKEILTQGTSIQQLGDPPKEPEVTSAKDVDNVARKVSTDSCESLLFLDVPGFGFSFLSVKAHSTTFPDFPIL